jgi:uncharacterized protein with ATP-grasp and redox domains
MSTAEMMKVLIHESLHCAFSKEQFPFNNQKEEMYCERQAIQMTSEILSSPQCKIEDSPSVYGMNYADFSKMNEEELTEFLQSEFINKGYEHRPRDLDGNVNIMGHELQKGDKVCINGQNVGEIGLGGNILDQLDERQILMFGRGGGQVVFSDEKTENAQTLTIERNGEPVMQAYIIPYRPQGQ